MRHSVQDAELKPNNIGLRLFDQIDIYLHNEGIFVAQDMTSKLFLPYPSHDPYSTVFMSKKQYDDFHREIEEKAVKRVIISIGSFLKNIPDISLEGTSITAPISYAKATSVQLENDLIEV